MSFIRLIRTLQAVIGEHPIRKWGQIPYCCVQRDFAGLDVQPAHVTAGPGIREGMWSDLAILRVMGFLSARLATRRGMVKVTFSDNVRDMDSAEKRQSTAGRWVPLVFYGLIVSGWLGEGLAAGYIDALWLSVWTLPAPALYIWQLRRRSR